MKSLKTQITIASTEDLERAAKEFLQAIGSECLIALYGSMGAGKTTFTAALCKVLGVEDPVCSPTFTLVNEYRLPDGGMMYHFDFYRLKNSGEALDIGLYDYLDSGCLCLMEWPEVIEDLLPEETLAVHLEVLPDGTRILK
ncbi:MAG: tRNA (adenosine(37)-N6)-threonylcarbamoyltransferase complex ATPase subunit type 1 TsaE [Bacteroidales bacterium]|nr:tRNA (adenosine(37)-N6)-threonylcarbamoyltransferase complex ATPase subunit type 1 TsaE [Bacteroidales bacterium]